MLRRLVLLILLPLLLALLFPAPCFAADPALALDPDIDEGHRLFAHEKYEEALEHYLKALERNENDAELNYRAGMTYFCLMDFNSTIVYFEKAVELDPDIEQKYVFNTSTMRLSSSLIPGDRIIIDDLYYNYMEISRGDFVMLRIPGSNKPFAKLGVPLDKKIMFPQRVVGLPGDTLEIKNRDMLINNEKIYSTKLDIKNFFFISNTKTLIPSNNFFIVGDGDIDRLDSMFFGFAKREYIVGKPLLVYFSIDPENSKDRTRKDRLGLKIN
jgi:signal peptidase I